MYSRGRGRAIPAVLLLAGPWPPRRCWEAAPPRDDGTAPRSPRGLEPNARAAAPTRESGEAAAEASGGRGAPQAPQIPARLRGMGARVRPRRVPTPPLPPRAAHRSRVASLMQPPPPRRASGFRASSGPRASSEFLLGQRPQTRSYYCSRARSAFPPPPLARPASLPSRAGRLIPRCTAGFLGETARAAWLAPRAAGGRVLPQQRSRCPAGGSAYSKDARRLLSFVLGRELPGEAQPITTRPPLFPLLLAPTPCGLHPLSDCPLPVGHFLGCSLVSWGRGGTKASQAWGIAAQGTRCLVSRYLERTRARFLPQVCLNDAV